MLGQPQRFHICEEVGVASLETLIWAMRAPSGGPVPGGH